jgi:hypothetical protein
LSRNTRTFGKARQIDETEGAADAPAEAEGAVDHGGAAVDPEAKAVVAGEALDIGIGAEIPALIADAGVDWPVVVADLGGEAIVEAELGGAARAAVLQPGAVAVVAQATNAGQAPGRAKRHGVGRGDCVVAVGLEGPGRVDDRASPGRSAGCSSPLPSAGSRLVALLVQEEQAETAEDQGVVADIELVDPLEPAVVAGGLAEVARGVAAADAPMLKRRSTYS